MIISSLLERLSRPRFLWSVIFFYTLIAGLFVQLILLPYLAPNWHAGNGLVMGVDGSRFHRLALELSQAIRSEGWSAWEPMPKTQLVSGVAAIFYVLIYPAPWSVLPFNALLSAFAGTGFYLLLCLFIGDRKKSVIATLPFIFFPSAMLWNTQFHNENYVVPATVFILLGWMIIYTPSYYSPRIQRAPGIVALALITAGSVLLLLTRGATLLALSAIFLICTLALSAVWLWQNRKQKTGVVLYRVGLSWMACTLMLIGPNLQLFDGLSGADGIDPENQARDPRKIQSDPTNEDPSDIYNAPQDPSRKHDDMNTSKFKWQQSSWLPGFVDEQFEAVAESRAAFLRAASGSGSLIDEGVLLSSASQMIAYIPRALEIGLLSPFPNIWFEEAEKPVRSAMRFETAFEMIFSYGCLLGLPIFAWKNRKKQGLLALLLVCLGMLVLYAITTPNQGALYRFRYPYYAPLVCLGLAGWLTRADPADSGAED